MARCLARGSQNWPLIAVSPRNDAQEDPLATENPYNPPEAAKQSISARRPVATGRVAYAAGAAFLLGFALWACSRPITGNDEPWDAPYPFYSAAMILGGIVVGIIAPKRFVPALLGVWLGQIAAIAAVPWLAAAGWLALGIATTAFGSLFLLPGLILGWGVHSAIKSWRGDVP